MVSSERVLYLKRPVVCAAVFSHNGQYAMRLYDAATNEYLIETLEVFRSLDKATDAAYAATREQ